MEQSCHPELAGPPSEGRGRARNMSAMAASEALRAPEGHPRRGSNAFKLGLRVVVSAALLVVPRDEDPLGFARTEGHARGHAHLPRARARAHLRRVRALGLALAASAGGLRRPHPAEDAPRLLPRRSVRRQRASVDDRRRRPPHQPGIEDHRGRHRVRVGRDRTPDRFRGAARSSRCSASPSSRRCSTSRTRGSPSSSPSSRWWRCS